MSGHICSCQKICSWHLPTLPLQNLIIRHYKVALVSVLPLMSAMQTNTHGTFCTYILNQTYPVGFFPTLVCYCISQLICSDICHCISQLYLHMCGRCFFCLHMYSVNNACRSLLSMFLVSPPSLLHPVVPLCWRHSVLSVPLLHKVVRRKTS